MRKQYDFESKLARGKSIMEIYVDVVFLINFIMDFFILWIVSKLMKKKVRLWRLMLGAFVAAFLYCIMMFFTPLNAYMNIFAAITILMIAIVATFKLDGVKDFIKLVLLSHVSAFTVGGVAIGLSYFVNVNGYIGNFLNITVNNFSFKVLIAATCAAYITIKLSSAWLSRVLIKKQVMCPVKIYFDGEKTLVNALVDTGNQLHDPITDYPVMVAEFSRIKHILPDNIKLIFYENKEKDLSVFLQSIQDTPMMSKIRMIPFQSLGKQNGMLIGFKPDKIVISDTKEIERKDIIIGIYNSKLSNDGTYEALLNPDVFC